MGLGQETGHSLWCPQGASGGCSRQCMGTGGGEASQEEGDKIMRDLMVSKVACLKYASALHVLSELTAQRVTGTESLSTWLQGMKAECRGRERFPNRWSACSSLLVSTSQKQPLGLSSRAHPRGAHYPSEHRQDVALKLPAHISRPLHHCLLQRRQPDAWQENIPADSPQSFHLIRGGGHRSL